MTLVSAIYQRLRAWAAPLGGQSLTRMDWCSSPGWAFSTQSLQRLFARCHLSSAGDFCGDLCRQSSARLGPASAAYAVLTWLT